jgi:hypothetical protein
MRSRTIAVWSLAVSILGLASQTGRGHSLVSPYSQITGSNVFRLRPAETLAPEVPVAPRASLRLVGITGLLGHQLALLQVQLAALQAEPAQEFSSILGEGQRDRGIEVLSIDAKGGRVEVNSFGTKMTVGFEPEAPPGAPAAPRRVLPAHSAMASLRVR